MPSKESLERAANYNRHDWHGTTSDGINRYCELCVKLADLLDEAIRAEAECWYTNWNVDDSIRSFGKWAKARLAQLEKR